MNKVIILRALNALSHLTLKIILRGRDYNYLFYTVDKTDA